MSNWKRDPYLYEDASVLRNIPGIKDSDELKRFEGDITRMTMAIAYAQEYQRFDSSALCQIHRTIFGSIYDWAGEFRTINMVKSEDVLGGDTVRYAHPDNIKWELDECSKEIAKLKYTDAPKDLIFKIVRITASLWHTHPFREGNTRAVVAFSVLLAAKFGIEIDYELFAKHAAYVRNALVWCTQGMYSKFEYLERIYFDAAGLLDDTPTATDSTERTYSSLGDYHVSNYREQPHVYKED